MGLPAGWRGGSLGRPQKSLEDRKQALIDAILKEPEAAMAAFDGKLAKLGYQANSGKRGWSHHKKAAAPGGEAQGLITGRSAFCNPLPMSGHGRRGAFRRRRSLSPSLPAWPDILVFSRMLCREINWPRDWL
jgi:hypothetical protein